MSTRPPKNNAFRVTNDILYKNDIHKSPFNFKMSSIYLRLINNDLTEEKQNLPIQNPYRVVFFSQICPKIIPFNKPNQNRNL